MNKIYRNLIIITCLILFPQPNKAQSNKSLSDAVYYISEFVASEKFLKLKENHGDLELIDTIYTRALQYHNGDISEALLTLTFATLPFNKMPVHLPLLGTLDLHLPSVDENLFKKKIKNLPSAIYFDSPVSDFGDKDKVAHFFGNAFLGYNEGFFNLSKFMGIFVELFEASFEVGGGLDRRDILTNHLGEMFGKELNKNAGLMPSQIMKLYFLFYTTIPTN